MYKNKIKHMIINETCIGFKDTSTTLKLPVKVDVNKTYVFHQYVLSQFNDMGMLYNMDTEKVSYIRIGDPFDISSFLMSDDKLIIYGKNDNGCIVKIINFEHPVVQPGELE
jgi:cAMP phosphodiesterase